MKPVVAFIPLTKIDVEKREVWGVLAEERVDKSGEIMDYEKSKPHFEAWSKGFEEATDGASKGNLRAMHGKVAAGKLVHLGLNDELKHIEIGAKVVDDAEWAKCVEGVYTGFSVGGNYVKRWADPVAKARRYEAQPFEASLVDNPCMYGAKFSVLKAEGETEERDFKVTEPEQPEAEAAPVESPAPVEAKPTETPAPKAEEPEPVKGELLEAEPSLEMTQIVSALQKVESAITKQAEQYATQQGGMEKLVGESVAKALGELNKAAEEARTELRSAIGALETRVVKIELQPAPAGRPVQKSLGGGVADAQLVTQIEKVIQAAQDAGATPQVIEKLRLQAAQELMAGR